MIYIYTLFEQTNKVFCSLRFFFDKFSFGMLISFNLRKKRNTFEKFTLVECCDIFLNESP